MKEMKKISHKSGFTMVELIVVIAIILVLAAVIVPNLFKYIGSAARANCVETRHTLSIDIMSELILHDGIPQTEGEIPIPDDLKKYKCQAGGTYTAKYENGFITITCSEHDEDDGSSSSGYKSVKVSEKAERYDKALNMFFNTLYDSIVAERLDSPKNHIAYVQFNKGKITQISCYGDEADANKQNASGKIDARGQASSGITAEEMAALDAKLKTAMESTGYVVSGNGNVGRIYFDWDGNVITGRDPDGNYLRIGGQSAGTSIMLSADGGKKDAANLVFDNNDTGWTY